MLAAGCWLLRVLFVHVDLCHRAQRLGMVRKILIRSKGEAERETHSEVGRVALIGGHLSETTRDLTKGLGPARGGVSHHGHVHAHVAEVLGEGDASVDGSLTSGHGHVGGVGDKGGTLHDGVGLAVLDHGKLGEIHEHLCHFITALTAANIDDSLRVRVLGKRLGDNSLAAAEGTGDSAGSAEHRGEEGVENALAGEKWVVAGKLLRHGAGGTHGPELCGASIRFHVVSNYTPPVSFPLSRKSAKHPGERKMHKREKVSPPSLPPLKETFPVL